MLRFYVLALLLLGGLVSCGPSDAERAALEDSRWMNAMDHALVINPDAGTRVITDRDAGMLRLEWDGGGPVAGQTNCLQCRDPYAYRCPGSKTSPDFRRSLGYTLPRGLVVVGAKANVYGATVSGTNGQVVAKLNNHTLTTGDAGHPNIESTSRQCNGNNYKCDGPSSGANGVTLSVLDKVNGIGWMTDTGTTADTDGGTPGATDAGTAQGNQFVLEPTSNGYCISHADLELTVVERHIKAAPTTVDFGNQAVGTESNSQPVDVINNGAASLTISKIEVSEGFILVEPTVPNTGIVVNPASLGATPLQITVKFAPGINQVRQFNGKLKITSDAMEEVLPVDLSGTGVESATEVDKDAIEFGLVRAKSIHKSGVTVHNAGSETLTITPSLTAYSHPSFTLDPTTAGPIFIPGGHEETINVIFQGPEDTEAEVDGNLVLGIEGDPKNDSKLIPITGSANKPILPASPTLNFGAQRAGTNVEDRVTVTNTGSRPITFSSIGAPNSTYFEILEQQPAGASVTLLGGGGTGSTLSFRVRFKVPTATEDQVSSSITLTNQDTTDPDYRTYAINLLGSGNKPILPASPTLNFGDRRAGSSVEDTVTVTNTGSRPITFSSIGTPNPTYFQIIDQSPAGASVTLQGGGGQDSTLSFRVRFIAPSTPGDPISGSIALVNTDSVYKNYAITLSGRAVKPNIGEVEDVDFGESVVGGTPPPQKFVTITNSGSGPVTFSQVFIEGDTDAFSLVPAQTGPLDVPPGPKRLTVQFSPTFEDATSAKLKLISSDPAVANIDVDLTGVGIRPVLQVERTPLAFGEQSVGAPGTQNSVTLSNLGSGKLQISNISTGGAPFTVSPSLPFEVTKTGGPGTLTVTFAPTAVESFTRALTFSTNDPDNANVSIELSGAGRHLLKVVEPASRLLGFGPVPLNDTKSLSVTLSNEGSQTITVQPPVLTGSQFSSSFTTSVQLGPNNRTYQFEMRFTPTATGPTSKNVELRSNASNPVYLTLSGTGAQPGIGITVTTDRTQTELNFGNLNVGQRDVRSLTIENTGDADLVLNGITIQSIQPSSPAQFSTATLPAKRRLPPKDTVAIQVEFVPTVDGLISADLKVSSNVAGADVTFPLRGNGLSASIVLPETSLDFGVRKLGGTPGEKPLTIRNKGEAELVIHGIDLSAGFSLKPPLRSPTEQAPWRVAARTGSYPIDLLFTPTVLGPVSGGALKIYSNDVNRRESSVTLNGTGVDGEGVTDPSGAHLFPVTTVGESARKNFQITNEGEYPLTLRGATVSNPTAFAVVNFENGRVLQKDGVYNFFVDFVPKFHGEHTGNLSITTDSETRPTLGVALVGNALGPQAFLPSTGYINFGKIPVQSTSVAQLSVQNSGQGVLSIQDITFTNKFASTDGGTPSVDDSAQIFGVAPSEDGGLRLPMYVDAGMTVSIPLTFRPIEKSTREAVVTVKSNAQDVSKDAIGEGTRAILSLSPKILNFNGVLIGTYSQPQTFTLKNIGSDSVDIENITLSLNGEQVFDIQPAMKSFPLAAGGGEETFSVTFHPTEERSFADVQLTVTPVPKGYHVSSERMTLSGRGILKPISVDSELVFGKRLIRNDAIKPLLIRNETGEAINFVRATVDSAPGCSQFKQDPTQSAGFTLGPFESKPLNVIFTPLSGGAVNCTLKLEFGQFMDKVPVALQGEGISTLLSADKSTLDFGRLRAGLQQRVEQFTLTNLSDDTITLLPLEETLTMGERFTLKEAELLRDGGLEIPGGKSFTVNVEYKPQGETRSESTLLFGTRTPRQDRAVTLHLTGTATKQIVGVNETGLEFGQVDVNGKPASKTVTVTNGSFQAQRVIVSVAQAGSPFSAKVGPSGLDIPAQGSATFQVEFEPKAPGDVEDQVLIKLQDSTTADVVITVKGAGRILSGHGNGVGCSAGGAWGSASVLALLTLVGLRSRRRRRE